MKSKKETFADVFQTFRHRCDLRTSFDDFLTITMCAVTQNPLLGKSHYEDAYMATIAKYDKEDVRTVFPKLFALLIMEMDERLHDSSGNDVLGECFELNFSYKGTGQFFTPYSVCKLLSKCTIGDVPEDTDRPLRVLDPTCGSGRLLIASAKDMGWQHEYYGIDIDLTCVKMTALNLFLNGIFHSEVMWADALDPNDFRVSYALSFLPLGIFKIEQKEKSKLWHLYNNSFEKKQPAPPLNLTLPSESGDVPARTASQLQLF